MVRWRFAGGGVAGLGASDGKGVVAGEDDAVALCVDLADGAWIESEADVGEGACVEMDARESGEFALRVSKPLGCVR